jgi:hypothetical protein
MCPFLIKASGQIYVLQACQSWMEGLTTAIGMNPFDGCSALPSSVQSMLVSGCVSLTHHPLIYSLTIDIQRGEIAAKGTRFFDL